MALVSMIPSQVSRTAYKNFMIFCMTKIASQVADAHFPSDLLQVIKVKLARRVFKLGTSCVQLVQDQALEVCERLKAIQQQRWQEILEDDAKRHTKLEIASFSGDTSLTLDASSLHLEAIMTPSTLTATPISPVIRECPIWLDMSDDLPRFSSMASRNQETHFVTFEFEKWVSGTLPHWLESASNSPSTAQCMELWSLASRYHQTASTVYSQSPEGVSTMILVLAELWHALDVLASKIQPLLRRFGPEIPVDLFSPLLLPRQSQMDRLRQVEQYIIARHERAAPENPSMFSDPSKRCFAAQLYESSKHHQDLRSEILEFAEANISRKRIEWAKETQRYRKIKDEAKAMVCQYTVDEDENENENVERHIPSQCPKCRHLKVAADMSIDKYERPLPADAVHRDVAVVELDFPSEMVAWRNMTWMLVHDIGRSVKASGASPS